MSDVTVKECPACEGSGLVRRYYGIDGCGDCLATGRVLSDGASLRVSVTRLTAEVGRRVQCITERDAEVATLTEQRDLARSVLRDIACHWQCLECGAVCPSSTWFGSRNKVFIIGRLVHADGCGVVNALGEMAGG